MNQELSDKLYKAGFTYEADFVALENYPTLGDLVDAMPMRRKDLGTINDAHFVLRKLVTSKPKQYRAAMEDEDNGNYIEGFDFIADTAEESVALLWLALDKKDKEKNMV